MSAIWLSLLPRVTGVVMEKGWDPLGTSDLIQDHPAKRSPSTNSQQCDASIKEKTSDEEGKSIQKSLVQR